MIAYLRLVFIVALTGFLIISLSYLVVTSHRDVEVIKNNQKTIMYQNAKQDADNRTMLENQRIFKENSIPELLQKMNEIEKNQAKLTELWKQHVEGK